MNPGGALDGGQLGDDAEDAVEGRLLEAGLLEAVHDGAQEELLVARARPDAEDLGRAEHLVVRLDHVRRAHQRVRPLALGDLSGAPERQYAVLQLQERTTIKIFLIAYNENPLLWQEKADEEIRTSVQPPVPVASYLQMSSARLASPESDATLRATSCTASASNTLSPESRAATISLS